jgi:HTH-type transcriptional regulator / antitoxin MqsA
MICPFCDQPAMKHAVRDMPFEYKGHSTIIPHVDGDFCDACGEMIMSDAESQRVGLAMRDFRNQVDASA